MKLCIAGAGALCLALHGLAALAQPASSASGASRAASAAAPQPASAARSATAAPQPASAPQAAAAARPASPAASSIKVKVMFVAGPRQDARPAPGAAVRLKGAEQTFTTSVAGDAEVFGPLPASAELTVLVVDAAPCKLPLGGARAVTVVVPKKGQGKCRFGQ